MKKNKDQFDRYLDQVIEQHQCRLGLGGKFKIRFKIRDIEFTINSMQKKTARTFFDLIDESNSANSTIIIDLLENNEIVDQTVIPNIFSI